MKKVLLLLACILISAPSYSLAAKKKSRKFPHAADSTETHDAVELRRYQTRSYAEFCSTNLKADSIDGVYNSGNDGYYHDEDTSRSDSIGNGQI